jgi:hypothetical protein
MIGTAMSAVITPSMTLSLVSTEKAPETITPIIEIRLTVMSLFAFGD